VATKHALEGLTDVMRLEMDGTGIDLILIEPGPIATRIRQNAIPHFEKWIDWENSARRAQYAALLDRLYKPDQKKDRWELPPSAVTEKLIHALESPRPRARYYVTVPTHLAGILKRLLPTRLLDRMVAKG
jgi:NAD(P)-dependent dehydrogenase (short-subunit alcohol dehydrogenase family)